jgi:hypothetical protein
VPEQVAVELELGPEPPRHRQLAALERRGVVLERDHQLVPGVLELVAHHATVPAEVDRLTRVADPPDEGTEGQVRVRTKSLAGHQNSTRSILISATCSGRRLSEGSRWRLPEQALVTLHAPVVEPPVLVAEPPKRSTANVGGSS